MDRQKLYRIMEEYFAISQEEVEKTLTKRGGQIDQIRLEALLNAVTPYCGKFLQKLDKNGLPVVDEKLKRKAGNVFLSKLNYSSFDEFESANSTYYRVDELFSQITKKGINPYKTIYCTVLTDGNLCRGEADLSTRQFLNIYDKVGSILRVDDKEIVDIFEKSAATLIGKCYTFQMDAVFNEICSFVVYGAYNVERNVIPTYIFKPDEVRDIFKNSPSLFGSTSMTVGSAFKYIQSGVKIRQSENDKIELWEQNLLKLRAIFKNNPSLLKINVSELSKKENCLYGTYYSVDRRTSGEYRDAFVSLFRDASLITLMDVIKIDDIQKNAEKNIKSMENFFSPQQISKYIVDNPFMLAMNNSKFDTLLRNIDFLDKEKGVDGEYLTRFLEQGRSLFKNTSNIEDEKILSKIQKDAIIEIDVDKMTEEDAFEAFLEIFFDEDEAVRLEIETNRLFFERDMRDDNGEKTIRKSIRDVGQAIAGLSGFLKDKSFGVREKKSEILRLAGIVGDLRYARFKLARTQDIATTEHIEQKIGNEIEAHINKFRARYNEKRFHIAKRYTNTDKLFEKTMQYLGLYFDDKKPIDDLFLENVSEPFSQFVEENFDVTKNATLFGDDFIVKVDRELKKPLQELSENIMISQSFEKSKKFTFESIEKEKDCTK